MSSIIDKTAWNSKYKDLLTYFETTGNSRVPYRYASDLSLGRWVQRQRNHKDILSKSQLKKLSLLKFVWSSDLRKEQNKEFFQMVGQLKKFKKIHDHCNVPSKCKDFKKLGRWVETIRLTQKSGKLQDWKIKKLEQLGLTWSNQLQDEKKLHWYKMFDTLTAFKNIHGHCNVPEGYKDDLRLAVWVIAQRHPKKALSEPKIKLLNEIGFEFKPYQKQNRKRNSKGKFEAELGNSL